MITRVSGCFAAILLFSTAADAIENLRIFVQGSNVVLSWPSTNLETYIVQYRPTLTTNTPWEMLATNYPPAFDTNWTTFVHSNVIRVIPSTNTDDSGSAGGGPPAPPPSSAGFGSSARAVPSSTLPDTADLPYPWNTRFQPENRIVSTQFLEHDSVVSSPSVNTSLADETGFYRVVRTGLSFFGANNQTVVSNRILLLVEAGYTCGSLVTITVTSDSSATAGATSLAPPFAFPIAFTFDTARLINGGHSITANGVWLTPRVEVFDKPFTQIAGQPLAVTVSNAICYPLWNEDVSEDWMQMNAVSTRTNVDWDIDVFGAALDYIGTFSGHTVDGSMDVWWNLCDPYGVKRQDNIFYTQTVVYNTNGSYTVKANPISLKKPDNYPWHGKWVVALLDHVGHTWDHYDDYFRSMSSLAWLGEMNGGVLPGPPYRSSTRPFMIRTGTTNAVTDWIMLWQTLTNKDVRNFYYFGHGEPNLIGDDVGGFGSTFFRIISGNSPGSTNNQRFRFVWLDGCKTADGEWPSAFGLGKQENKPLESYTTRPGAFMGMLREFAYAQTVRNATNGIVAGSVSAPMYGFRSSFALYWDGTLGRTLQQAIISARNDSGWDITWLKVYGYNGLRVDEFNYRTDWPPR